MLSMQTFYTHSIKQKTTYLETLQRIVQAPRKAIKDLAFAAEWKPW